MLRKHQPRASNRRAEIPAKVFAHFKDEPSAPRFLYFMAEAEIKAAWCQVRNEILDEWVRERPGTRPRVWWRYEAPGPRRRVGGTGQAAHEVSAHVEVYEWGLPTYWVSQADVDERGADSAGVAVDPSDPPCFESQAIFLERLGLLRPGELERLTEADSEPEAIEVE